MGLRGQTDILCQIKVDALSSNCCCICENWPFNKAIIPNWLIRKIKMDSNNCIQLTVVSYFPFSWSWSNSKRLFNDFGLNLRVEEIESRELIRANNHWNRNRCNKNNVVPWCLMTERSWILFQLSKFFYWEPANLKIIQE